MDVAGGLRLNHTVAAVRASDDALQYLHLLLWVGALRFLVFVRLQLVDIELINHVIVVRVT